MRSRLVLILEAECVTRLALHRHLETKGYRVLFPGDHSAEQPDVVVLGTLENEQDPLALLRRLGIRENVPVISTPTKISARLFPGRSLIVQKPYDCADISAAIGNLLV